MPKRRARGGERSEHQSEARDFGAREVGDGNDEGLSTTVLGFPSRRAPTFAGVAGSRFSQRAKKSIPSRSASRSTVVTTSPTARPAFFAGPASSRRTMRAPPTPASNSQPRRECPSSCGSRSCGTSSRTRSAGIAKPMPPSAPARTAALMPITRPLMSSNGPPTIPDRWASRSEGSP
jgi:hypothetical protein